MYSFWSRRIRECGAPCCFASYQLSVDAPLATIGNESEAELLNQSNIVIHSIQLSRQQVQHLGSGSGALEAEIVIDTGWKGESLRIVTNHEQIEYLTVAQCRSSDRRSQWHWPCYSAGLRC